MEGMDGISAIEALKTIHPAAKIVIVTDYNDKPLRQLAEKHGVEAYVLKENLPEIRIILQGEV
jgi:DNA-binding NarL/FixJ family response regulator